MLALSLTLENKLRKIRVGIIGGGSNSAVGRAHISALSMDRSWSIESILPSAQDALRYFPENLGLNVQVSKNIDQFFQFGHENKLDFIINLTPSNIHFETGKKILENGFNLIVEKPMSLNVQHSIVLSDIAKSKNLKLWTIQNYSNFVMVMAMKKFLSLASIGELLHVYVKMLQQGYIRRVNGEHTTIQNWRLQDPPIPMVMHDLGSHVLHMIGFLTTDFPKQVISNFNYSTVHKNLISSCEIIGKGGHNTSYSILLGKTFFGNQNSFQIELFGSKGSVKWELNNSEEIEYISQDGVKRILDRAWAEQEYPDLLAFSRFKPGHDAGFVESLANNYLVLKEEFENNNKLNFFLTFPDQTVKYLKVMEACAQSAASHSWTKIRD
jgi:predicted dehydrogenase